MGNSDVQFKHGHKYLGGYNGEYRNKWIQNKIEKWENLITTISQAAYRYPQSAYTAFAQSLQDELIYIQRANRLPAQTFQLLEIKIKEELIFALFQSDLGLELPREISSMVVQNGGHGLANLAEMTLTHFDNSIDTTFLLCISILSNQPLDVGGYQSQVTKCRQANQAKKDKKEEKLF